MYTWEKFKQHYLTKDALLVHTMALIGILFIFMGYNKPMTFAWWLVCLFAFYTMWEEPTKDVWMTMFVELAVLMIIVETLVIYYTGALSYNYPRANIFGLVPHWLPIAYFSNFLFIIFHYKVYKNIMKDE